MLCCSSVLLEGSYTIEYLSSKLLSGVIPGSFFHYPIETIGQKRVLQIKWMEKVIQHFNSQPSFTILTYGVKTFTHRGGLSDLLYWKQNAIDSSSLSQREMVFHCNSTVCASRAPSSRQACSRKLFIPTAGTTWPSLRLSQAQCGNTMSP